uniref:HIT domain-containing protein n=1 Tax=Araucaria cunninghamii TaxID=56994 RepID=A0A0D6R7T8_ARACU
MGMASVCLHFSSFRSPFLRAGIGKRMSKMTALVKPIGLPQMTTSLSARRLSCSPRDLADEEAAAKAAAVVADTSALTIFDKIIKKEIPSTIVYEDEKVLAFRDINPQAPVHILLIPKQRDELTQLSKAEPRHTEILGHMLYTAKVVAEHEGISEGYRVVINNGPAACQSVYHLHLHVLGGRQMKWPPG